jgi:hypothetical protein
VLLQVDGARGCSLCIRENALTCCFQQDDYLRGFYLLKIVWLGAYIQQIVCRRSRRRPFTYYKLSTTNYLLQIVCRRSRRRPADPMKQPAFFTLFALVHIETSRVACQDGESLGRLKNKIDQFFSKTWPKIFCFDIPLPQISHDCANTGGGGERESDREKSFIESACTLLIRP